jgi:hypothetical protein
MTLETLFLRPAALALAASALLSACGGGGGGAGSSGGSTPAVTTVAPQVTLTLSNGAGTSGTLLLTLEADKAPVTTLANAPCAAWAAFLSAGECLPSPNFTITSAVQTR